MGGRADWGESLEESVAGGVLFLPGRRGQEAPGLGVAGWTPVTEFLWLLKLRKDCRGQEMSLETIMGYCNGLRKGWILVLSGRQQTGFTV